MRRCGYCKKILILFPWSHYAFSGDERYHVECFQEMNLELTYVETQVQYGNLPIDANEEVAHLCRVCGECLTFNDICDHCEQQFTLRSAEEDLL